MFPVINENTKLEVDDLEINQASSDILRQHSHPFSKESDDTICFER